jgi:predicted nucleic acid-binding protein
VVVFDATMFLLAIKPNLVRPPLDKATGKLVDNVEVRINALIEKLSKEKTKIIIPAPALSELLVSAGSDTQSLVQEIQRNAIFRIEPFDTLAAIEVAMMTRQALNKGDKRNGANAVWAKIKYDRQIVAIAKIHRATTIYSDDEHIGTLCKRRKINIVGIADLPVPTKELQLPLFHTLDESRIDENNVNEELDVEE